MVFSASKLTKTAGDLLCIARCFYFLLKNKSRNNNNNPIKNPTCPSSAPPAKISVNVIELPSAGPKKAYNIDGKALTSTTIKLKAIHLMPMDALLRNIAVIGFFNMAFTTSNRLE